MLGVAEPSRAGIGDYLPGHISDLDIRGEAAGDDREHSAGPEHPLAGGIQQTGLRIASIGRRRPGADAGDGEPGPARVRIAGGQQQIRPTGPQPRERPGLGIQAGPEFRECVVITNGGRDEAEDVPAGCCGGLDHRHRAVNGGYQITGP